MKARQEKRESLVSGNAYVSDTSSYEAADSDENGSFDLGEDGGVIQSKTSVACLLATDQPSSEEEEENSNSESVRPTLKTSNRLSKMREKSERKTQKHKKMILEEFLNLLERPSKTSSPQAGNFYSKFQNIDKII